MTPLARAKPKQETTEERKTRLKQCLDEVKARRGHLPESVPTSKTPASSRASSTISSPTVQRGRAVTPRPW
eukprot:907844-Karenia_brevis.AAC.1